MAHGEEENCMIELGKIDFLAKETGITSVLWVTNALSPILSIVIF